MTQPSVTLTELDGQLGVLPPSSGQLLAIVGVSSSGPVATPATFAKVKDVVANFGAGPLVEAAAYAITNYGNPVAIVRAGVAVAGSAGTIDVSSVTGSSVVTVHSGSAPLDQYQVKLKVVNGGTIAAAGITLQTSLDGGRTYRPIVALGTASTYVVPEAGVQFDFAAGTLVTGDTVSVQMVAPNWDTTTLPAALSALRDSAITWETCLIVGPVASAALTAIDSAFAGMAAAHKYRWFVANTRQPTRTASPAETEAAYLSSLTTAFASVSSTHGMLCAGDALIISGVSGRQYMSPAAYALGALNANVSHEIDIADINLGSLPGVSVTDDNGNNLAHDESLNPGLDDVRFSVLRTWDAVQGVFNNRPRLFSPTGSDFEIAPHRRVINVAEAALYQYLIRRLNRPVLVNPTTGFLTEASAREIENGGTAVLRAALLAKPKASAVSFVVSRTDNILSTKTLTGQARIVPLGYVEFIQVDIAYTNPALAVK